MKVFQDTQAVQYLQDYFQEDAQTSHFLQQYLKPLLHSGLGRIIHCIKRKGFSVMGIVQFFTLLPLMGLYSIGGIYPSEYAPFVLCGKDTLYRIKNNANIPWRKLLWSVGRRFLKLAGSACQDTGSPKCLILDDTDLGKTGKKIEGVGKIWSHVFGRQILGFKMLTMGLWDGKSFLPVDFSLHREKGSKPSSQPFGLSLKAFTAQFTKKRKENQAGYVRKKELDEKKTNVALSMIGQAVRQGFKADFVLCDSWFFNFELLQLTVKKGMHLIAGVKMGKLTFVYKGKAYSPKALVQIVTRKAKYCRKLKAHYISLPVSYKGIDIRLFFVRYGRQTKWRIIICSNPKLSFLKTMEIYQIRWSIEVFFKEAKQYLGISKCQSNDFDAHIAHISIAMILYMGLALKKRFSEHETIGQLFRHAKVEMTEMTLAQKLWAFFIKVIRKLTEFLDLDVRKLMKILFDDKAAKAFFDIFQKMNAFI
jgi:hypothetical protein